MSCCRCVPPWEGTQDGRALSCPCLVSFGEASRDQEILGTVWHWGSDGLSVCLEMCCVGPAPCSGSSHIGATGWGRHRCRHWQPGESESCQGGQLPLSRGTGPLGS